MRYFKKKCKERLSIFCRVEIEKDVKSKLYYLTFRSFTNEIRKTLSFKQMRDEEQVNELIEEIYREL